jgi:hypothetical protein
VEALMDDEKLDWLDIVEITMAFISLGCISLVSSIQGKITNAFNKLRNRMSNSEEKETVQETKTEDKKEAVILPVFDIRSLIGKQTSDAVKLATDNGFTTRIVSEDGKSPMMGDCMVDLNRLRLDVVNGLITKVVKG